ncbi:hypothetical protein CH063_12810 [Colletotrichum higginsianum]|uniref:Uncharacterized protein n=1 Tax=Colletotrichum higginsianum (strain IMI 349063) TaxID=759273 RepID=H1VRV6_COLHI|nr:hypothetical protein CH063_12810 [Colletotrichum higginsianum]
MSVSIRPHDRLPFLSRHEMFLKGALLVATTVICSTGDPCGLAALGAQLNSQDLLPRAVQAHFGCRPFCGFGEHQTIGHELGCSDAAWMFGCFMLY